MVGGVIIGLSRAEVEVGAEAAIEEWGASEEEAEAEAEAGGWIIYCFNTSCTIRGGAGLKVSCSAAAPTSFG